MNENNENFCSDDSVLGIFAEASRRDCHCTRQIKEPLSWEILQVVSNLQVSLKMIRNRLVQVTSCYIHDMHYIHDISWKLKFREYIRFDLDKCSIKCVINNLVLFDFDLTFKTHTNVSSFRVYIICICISLTIVVTFIHNIFIFVFT